MPDKLYRATEYNLAATLKASGVRYVGAEPGHRVVLLFDDGDGRASQIADRHVNGGVEVNSATLAASLSFIKDTIFATRREAGLAR